MIMIVYKKNSIPNLINVSYSKEMSSNHVLPLFRFNSGTLL